MERDYNTTRPDMIIREYGRNVQNLVEYALTIEDRDKRTKLAYIIISVMQQVNPTTNANDEYYKKLWNHIYAISNYKLDVEYPFEVHRIDVFKPTPNHLEYKDNIIRYRFYGRNTELVLKDLTNKEAGEERDKLLIIMANQMKEMYIGWNKTIVSDEIIGHHIQEMTNGVLSLPDGAELISSNTILKKIQSNLVTKKANPKNAKKSQPRKSQPKKSKKPKNHQPKKKRY